MYDLDAVVVADRAHRRLGGRLVDVIAGGWKADLWDPADFTLRLPKLRRETINVFLGEHQFARYLYPTMRLELQQYGIRWGMKGRKAAIWTVDDVVTPDATLETLEKLTRESLDASRNIQRASISSDYSPPMMTANWLDPGFAHQAHWGPQTTVLTTPSARLHNAQYVYGVARLLFDGWKRLVEAPVSIIPKG
jgi:hypothetical protein